MRAMKDSGIQWIGQIPEEWGLERLKYHASLNPTTELPMLSDGDEVSFIPMEHLKSGFHLQSIVPYMKVKKGYVCFADGDILMAKVTPCLENGNLAIAGNLRKNIGFGSTEINVIRCNTIVNRFLFYLLQCHTYIDIARHHMYGVAGLKRLDPEFIPNTVIPVPSEKEQLKIVSYLDSKCAEIDTLIATKEKTNALLKERRQSIIYEAVTKGLNPDAPMKDSGVEWIGQIPEHWERIALKYCIQQIGSGTSVNAEDRPANTDEMGVLKTSCVSSGCFAALENKAILENEYDRATCPVKADTVIVSRMNTPDLVGACGYVEEAHPNLYLPDRLWQVEFNKDCVAKYMWYFLTSKYVRNYYASVCTGTSGSMQNISQDQFGAIAFFKPSKTEQQSIAEYLDRECETLLSLIDVNEQSLQKLKEYRQSIIYEAVTGKIEV